MSPPPSRINGTDSLHGVLAAGKETLATGIPEVYQKESKDGRFPVIEIFGPTIQGEGSMIGVKTLFIRMGGCDFRCAMCDSLHAVIPAAVKKNATWMTPQEIHDACIKLAGGIPLVDETIQTPWITLSGGNPVMWDLDPLMDLLNESGFVVALETQGSIWRDWITKCAITTISPKGPGMGERFDPDQLGVFLTNLINANQLYTTSVKIPIFDQRDLEFAVEVGEILTNYSFPQFNRFLSLGNNKPPRFKSGTLELNTTTSEFFIPDLLSKMSMLAEDILGDWRLSSWRFLPQMHVLLWSNKAGV